ncbi:MAG TPA: MmcQ/YjbR family DNA-binding protein [Leadbetterella sp.]|nr:MmcQ/YjbR family DNA-binding protein [Leadbetterella sp.]
MEFSFASMPSLIEFNTLALSLPEVSIEPHFEKVSFRVKKKIFATLNEKESRATLKFTPDEQEMFCKINQEAIFPVPNKWGKMGWTHLKYELLSSEIIEELLKVAYSNIAPQNLKGKIQFKEF